MDNFQWRIACDGTDITKGFVIHKASIAWWFERGMRLYKSGQNSVIKHYNTWGDLKITGPDYDASGSEHEWMHFEASSSNNIGINDSTPSYTLDTNGDINATGEVRNSGSALTSDKRLKENVADMDPMLEKVLALRPVEFDWKEGSRGGRLNRAEYRSGDFGFIAQEMTGSLPNMVSTGDDPDETMGVNYAKMVCVLTKAVQELNDKIVALESQLSGSS